MTVSVIAPDSDDRDSRATFSESDEARRLGCNPKGSIFIQPAALPDLTSIPIFVAGGRIDQTFPRFSG